MNTRRTFLQTLLAAALCPAISKAEDRCDPIANCSEPPDDAINGFYLLRDPLRIRLRHDGCHYVRLAPFTPEWNSAAFELRQYVNDTLTDGMNIVVMRVQECPFRTIHLGGAKCDEVLGVHSEPIGGWEEITAESLTTRRTGLH